MQQRRASTNTQKVCNPKRRRHKKPGQPLVFSPSLCIYFQVSAILSKPAERPGRRRRRRRYTVSRKTRAKEGEKKKTATGRQSVSAAYLGDGLLVSHDSLLDERVHFHIPIPARHHDPGPAKTHRDFHGSSIRGVAWLRAETPRKGPGGGGGGRSREKAGRRRMELPVSPPLSRYSCPRL